MDGIERFSSSTLVACGAGALNGSERRADSRTCCSILGRRAK